MADKPDPATFIGADKDRRLNMRKGVRRRDVSALLGELADQAAADRKDITEHPFLRSAHAEIRHLKDRVNKHPAEVGALQRQILSLTTARDGTQRLYDDLLQRTAEIEDGLNRVLNENERLKQLVDAALASRDSYVAIIVAMSNVQEADGRLEALLHPAEGR